MHLRRSLTLALVLGALTFLAPHGAVIIAALGSYLQNQPVDFWAIQHGVVKGTVNFFPFGLLLSGESHSYAQAPFLQISFWGAMMLQIVKPFSWSRCLVTALLAAALPMAHPASAFLAVCTLVPVSTCILIVQIYSSGVGVTSQTLKSLAVTTLLAGLLYLPEYMGTHSPDVRWVVVSTSLASPTLQFISAQAAPLAILLLLFSANIDISTLGNLLRKRVKVLLAFSMLVFISALVGRPAISLAVLVFGLLSILTIETAGQERRKLSLFSLGLAIIWILPELLVSDWAIDNRSDWIRFNTVMRFWLEGYYLIPMVGFICLAPRITQSPVRFRFCMVSFAMLLLIQVASIYPLVENRIQRTIEHRSADGFSFMSVEHPADWWIIEYLARLPEQVVLGEACGTGSSALTPYHYGMPGRISAFSGRPSICGWARHTWMFQPRFRNGDLRGQSVWSSFLQYEKALRTIYGHASELELNAALELLHKRAVTHLVYGDLEEAIFGKLDLRLVAQRINGKVVIQPVPGRGIIKLPWIE